MKIRLATLCGVMCLSLLTGCALPPSGCWSHQVKQTSCGHVLIDRCESVCNRCKFDDPNCQLCWSCINHEGYPPSRCPGSCVRPR